MMILASLTIEFGGVFPKFPTAFITSSKLLFPSGHAMRMFIESIQSRAFLVMFVQKILCNFYSCGITKVDVKRRESLFHKEPTWLSDLSPRFYSTPVKFERCEETVWHSLDEWVIGYASGQKMVDGCMEAKNEVCSYLRKTVTCPLQGSEIFTFLRRGWPADSKVCVRLPSTSFTCGGYFI